MTCTLDLYTDYLLCSTRQTSATGLSRLLGGAVSHDQVTRFLTNSYLASPAIWQAAKPLVRRAEQQQATDDFAVLLVDDSILEKKHTDPNAFICTHWDHSQGRYVRGLNFLSLLYENGPVAVPLAVELIEKTEERIDPKTNKKRYVSKLTKNEHLLHMLQVAQQQVSYRYLIADSWYASADNMQQVVDLGHEFIFALAANRTVALTSEERQAGHFQAISTLVFPPDQPLRVYLRSLEPAVLISRQVFTNKDGSQGTLYLVTSDLKLDNAQISTIYHRRWKIEEYHKSLKQNTSMGQSPTREPNTQANHFFASILAYIKLENLKIQRNMGHFGLKATLYLAGITAMYKELVNWTA